MGALSLVTSPFPLELGLCWWRCYQARVHWLTHKEDRTMTSLLGKEKALLWNWQARKQEARLKSISVTQSLARVLRSQGEQADRQKLWWGRCWMESFGTWILVVRRGEGLQHLVFLASGPFTSERVQCSSSGTVPMFWLSGEKGWDFGSGSNWRSEFSSRAWLGCIAYGFDLLSLKIDSVQSYLGTSQT